MRLCNLAFFVELFICGVAELWSRGVVESWSRSVVELFPIICLQAVNCNDLISVF
jgi:hypothetical protein